MWNQKRSMARPFGALVVLAVLAAGHAAFGTPGPSGPLSVAIRVIAREERGLHCIGYHALWQNVQCHTGGKIEKNLVRSRVVLVGVPSGKFRWGVPESYTRGAVAPAIDRSESAFNGSVYTRLLVTISHGKGQWFSLNHRRVAATPGPDGRMVYSFSGWDKTIFGFTSMLPKLPTEPRFRRQRFSQYIAPNGQPKVQGGPATTLRAKWIRRNGHRLLEVTRVGWPSGVDQFCLDPARGYAIRYFAQWSWHTERKPGGGFSVHTGGPLMERFTAGKFKKILPGTFFPQRVTAEIYRLHPTPGAPRWRAKAVLRIGHIRVNSAVHLRRGTFAVTFPRGAQVTDARTGKTIIVAGTPKQQLKEIEKAVSSERSQVKSH